MATVLTELTNGGLMNRWIKVASTLGVGTALGAAMLLFTWYGFVDPQNRRMDRQEERSDRQEQRNEKLMITVLSLAESAVASDRSNSETLKKVVDITASSSQMIENNGQLMRSVVQTQAEIVKLLVGAGEMMKLVPMQREESNRLLRELINEQKKATAAMTGEKNKP